MSAVGPRAPWVPVTAATAFLVALLVWRPAAGIGFAGGVLVVGFIAQFFPRLPRAFLAALGVCLIGYAFMGRGFAYVGYPPLFVGEVLLAFGVATALLRGRLVSVLGSPATWPILAFMATGLVATLPFLGIYGLDAFRDAVVWGYAAFAFVVASLVRTEEQMWRAVRGYRAVFPVFLVFVSLMAIVEVLPGVSIPPTPFSDVDLISIKSGDVAVHLAGILGFVIFGVGAPSRTGGRRWWSGGALFWVVWMAAWITTLPGRAALLTVGMTGLAVMIARPSMKWLRLGAIAALLVLVAVALDLEINAGRGRMVSPQAIVVAFQSIFEPVGEGTFDGTRGWRLQWWGDIVNYTVFGEYFWTGKGYGINLANDDGFQVFRDESLRSPHNVHLTVLARSGVPGAVAWLALHATLALALLNAAIRRRAEGRLAWANLDLWLLAYWLAFVVNGSFDVFFEGPQGGIWFWSLVGFSLAALRIQGRASSGAEPSIAIDAAPR